MAFVNWTVFFASTFIERIKAIIGYIIGYLSAYAIMYFDRAKKLFLDSIPGIFVGIALTFSGTGVSLQVSDPKLL